MVFLWFWGVLKFVKNSPIKLVLDVGTGSLHCVTLSRWFCRAGGTGGSSGGSGAAGPSCGPGIVERSSYKSWLKKHRRVVLALAKSYKKHISDTSGQFTMSHRIVASSYRSSSHREWGGSGPVPAFVRCQLLKWAKFPDATSHRDIVATM